MAGKVNNKVKLAINWAANQPGITCAINGVRSVAQLQDALAGANLNLSQSLMQRLLNRLNILLAIKALFIE